MPYFIIIYIPTIVMAVKVQVNAVYIPKISKISLSREGDFPPRRPPTLKQLNQAAGGRLMEEELIQEGARSFWGFQGAARPAPLLSEGFRAGSAQYQEAAAAWPCRAARAGPWPSFPRETWPITVSRPR